MKKKRQNNLSYFEHLEILRWDIIHIIIFLFVFFIISFIFIEKIIFLIKMPIKNIQINLYYLKPYEKFLTYIKISFFTSILLTIPFALYKIFRFIYPALKKNEKKFFSIWFIFLFFIFIIGIIFSYFIIIPFVFKFFINFAKKDNIIPVWSISSYFDFFMMMILATGILFTLPLIILLLLKIKVLNFDVIKKMRKYVWVLIFIISGVFSPPDVLSQLLIAFPLIFLFELTILIYKFIK